MTVRRRAAGIVPALITSLALIALLAPAAAQAAGARRVLAGSVPQRGMNVVLLAAVGGGGRPVSLGRTRSRAGGQFTLRYRLPSPRTVKYVLATRPGGAAEAGFPVPGSSYRLAAAIGTGRVPRRVTLNELTTVAMGYAMAQFIHGGGRVGAVEPGLRNAAAMTRNLVRRASGKLSPVIGHYPNGGSTSALTTFDSLANLVATCRRQDLRCARFLRMAGVPGGGAAPDTLAAATNLARYPWQNVRGLFRQSLRARGLFTPALAPGERPDGWTLALSFEGQPPGMDGPGNIAIDAEGGIWVGNNYEYSRRSHQSTCFGKELFRFTPTGHTYPGSPYATGGASGVGFGISIDKENHVWIGNFGFAGRGCNELPPSNSVSEFEPDGTALSPDLEQTGWTYDGAKEAWLKTFKGGYEVGEISWPQATVADVDNNIWVANCHNNSVSKIPGGDPKLAFNFHQDHFTQPDFKFSLPFGIGTDDEGNVYVGGNGSATVVKMNNSGEVIGRFKGGGLHRPMDVVTDSEGNVWVSNSTWVVAPCEGEFHPERGPRKGGTVTLITRDGRMPSQDPFEGGGIENPWGIAIDGSDNVWVANFGGNRLSELCGAPARNCRPGQHRAGQPISPASGYGSDALTRNTGLAVDPSGNVWLANNWKNKPIQTNPGNYQIVAYLGLAAPVKTPLIGQPEAP